MLQVIANKGFQITFENGWTVSVMFGRGNYCHNRYMELRPMVQSLSALDSKDAEIGLWFKAGKAVVLGWRSADEVGKVLAEVQGWEAKEKAEIILKCLS